LLEISSDFRKVRTSALLESQMLNSTRNYSSHSWQTTYLLSGRNCCSEASCSLESLS